MANGTSYTWLLAVLALLIGALLGAYLFPTEVVKTVEVTKLQVVEVPVASETKYEVDSSPLARAEEALLKEIDENEDLWECDGDDYDPTQIKIIRIRQGMTRQEYTDDIGEYSVYIDTRLKYDNGEDHCYRNVDVEVRYDNDKEEPHVEVN